MNVGWQPSRNGSISAYRCSPSAELCGPWDELIARVDGNAFMHPAALLAAADTGFADIHVLIAWDEGMNPRCPVGFWALCERRNLPATPAFLEAIPIYASTSNAVIDRARADEVMAAFFDVIRHDIRLPKIIRLRSFEADPVVYPAMLRQLEGVGQHRELVRVERPFADRCSGIKKSGATRKKLRQDWNRLSATGQVEIVNGRTAPEAEAAFEVFLALEAASWKGKQGTALLCDAGDAQFARRLIRNLAAHNLASVALLSVDGVAITGQVLIYSGRKAYTWKTAFDASYARFSPGALLISKITEALLESGQVAAIDSCASADGIMAQLWTGRRTMVDALIDVHMCSSRAFAMEVVRHIDCLQFGSVGSRMWHAIQQSE
ncbi:CelD/BcsL family acetyltransferase involved in cellulose biosynthesis [Bradyrhizobium macuxiense]|uniref:CelD/BcsL family acetyltransferase involved in cellulose biosynthesis n=1 Tax=Bradyrhizobium macuxiense TaxID=1755647 RepID=A0A560MJN8_9BRAD|nr:GNAT family N-acetyltransferase [Bradyrhizobium macuxiense]TWC07544.1 CelD/BcsL family acetyltransferase involved in cellulose biosynthesis [Bradyrhizobium macuxiense]